MAERFTRLFQLGKDLYSSGSPVLVIAGALLKDEVTDSLVIQMKLQNLSAQTIVAAKVKLHTYDVAKKEVYAVEEYQYLDLNVGTGGYWGADKAIIVPEAGVRSFSIAQVSVLFGGSDTWKTTDFTSALSLPDSIPLERKISERELVSQYQITVNTSARFFPVQYGDIWRCSCGAVNRGADCYNCKAAKSVVFSALDTEALRKGAQERIVKEKEAKAKKEEQRKKQAKTIKKVAIVGLPTIAIALFFALWLYPRVLEPNSRYSNACNMAEAGQFDDAIEIFESLGDYRDTADWINAVKYAKASFLYDEGKNDEALRIFKALGDYGDSESRIKAIQYAEATALANDGKYSKAIEVFQALGDYEDAAEQVLVIKYQRADERAELGYYGEAVTLFAELGSYKDSEERVKMLRDDSLSSFTKAVQSGKYEDAQSLMNIAKEAWTPEMTEEAVAAAEAQYDSLMKSGQKDQATKLSELLQLAAERYYSEAIELIQSRDYDAAYGLLSNISEYKNAEKLIVAIDQRIDGVYSYKEGYYMQVTTPISLDTGDYWYRASRWCDSESFHFSQGGYAQTKTSGIEGDCILEYAGDYFRWTISADKATIVVEELYGDYAEKSLFGKVKETTTWTLLDEETGADALRRAQYLGIA